ncbi:hypothetical protein Dtox_0405 [Desulfofarcimen acetoxidans DSM 771]|uniref:SseB protein N-terminal domain-containing protein n=1 Tax=Desulfofarcimen acetoxidans (strain ATCC 49208 / DSM 771 / KCTC 5769 / VKM B-1644 / 5575) TaxID=485916 RepID=C8W4Z6_DESAS|nr:enhanced serine sensitivity protein SseB [Desulfofarcimen acetoxidans]ACV61348.1 hypothetical protein Dtox_0405 [Desulfofarcimen acetoxidans DSM 771]
MEEWIQKHDSGLDLTTSMERLRDNPSVEGKLRFFAELKAARLLVPCHGENGSIAALNTPEKEVFLPAFCSADELQKWTFPLEKVSVLPLDALKHIVIDNPAQLAGVVINPFGKALLLRHPQLAEIDSGTEGMTLARTDHQGKLDIRATTDFPVGLPKALAQLLATRPEVYRAWILLAREEKETRYHKLFLIDFDGDRRLLFPLVAKAVQPYMKPGESFELMKADFGLLQRALAVSEPVYQKKKA